MDELKEFMRSHLTARVKKFYRSAGSRSTVGYLKGIMGMGEEETPTGTVTWGTRGVQIRRKWYTWQEADLAVREIMAEADQQMDEMNRGEYEQMTIKDLPGVMP